MSLSCLSGSFSASWTELPLQCFYLPRKNNALQSSSCTKCGMSWCQAIFVPINTGVDLALPASQSPSLQVSRDVWKKPLPVKVVVIKGIAFVSFHVNVILPNSKTRFKKKQSRFLLTISQGSLNRTHFFFWNQTIQIYGSFWGFPL